jgi:hypothetical protein
MKTNRRDRGLRPFAVLTFPGLGEIAARELAGLRPSGVTARRLPNYDVLSFVLGAAGAEGLARLRTVEDILLLAAPPLAVGRFADLRALDGVVTREFLLEGVALRNRLFRPPAPRHPSYYCFVKQDRDYDLYRKRIASHVNDLVGRCFPKWRCADPAALEVWGLHVGGSLELGVRLTDASFRYRGLPPPERPGALRPTIAAAMVLLADPKPGETIIDPMCGTGTVLLEGVGREPGATWMGGDADAGAVGMAAERLCGTPVQVTAWDARRLPCAPGSADAVVCNLPFGRQFAADGPRGEFYAGLVSHWLRVLRRGGRMVLLTSAGRDLAQAVEGLPCRSRALGRVRVLGLWAELVLITAD